jgi:hypothetical protein
MQEVTYSNAIPLTIHYRLRDDEQFKTLMFDDWSTHIRLEELKEAICSRESFDRQSWQIVVLSSKTKLVYGSLALIPRNSYLMVKFIPMTIYDRIYE